VQGTGEYSVPLPLDASFDFTQIAWIILTIQSFSDTASSSLLASDFVAVPEPGAAVLVMTAILGLALRQKRHARFEWPCPRDEKRWTSGPPSSSRTSPRVTAHRM
jgi:hypothetical protein